MKEIVIYGVGSIRDMECDCNECCCEDEECVGDCAN